MRAVTLSFGLVGVDLHRPSTEAVSVPSDFSEVVSSKGDRFRDYFTRACLYLAGRNMPDPPAADTTVVVGTEYGNLDAMLRLQRLAVAGERRISAQQFPHATTSSAAVFVNLEQGVRGGNVTLNAGPRTPVVAILQGLLHVNAYPQAASHVLVGDVYCPEARDDIRKKAGPEVEVTSALCWVGLRSGDSHHAVVSFGPGPDGVDSGKIFADDATGPGPVEWNRALLTHRFLTAVGELPIGAAATLQVGAKDRVARLTVRRGDPR